MLWYRFHLARVSPTACIVPRSSTGNKHEGRKLPNCNTNSSLYMLSNIRPGPLWQLYARGFFWVVAFQLLVDEINFYSAHRNTSLYLTILKPPPVFVPALLSGIHLSVPLVWRVLQPVVRLKWLTFHLLLLIALQYKFQHPQLPQRWRCRSSGAVSWYCNGTKITASTYK